MSRARASRLVAPGSALVALVLYRATLAPGLTWAHYGADGGDLAVAVALGSVPHPTGYPTYLLLATLFAHLPWADLHARLNLMSAVMAALAVGATAWLVARLLSPAVAALAAALLTTSTLFWSQALITEVYALHALFVILIAAWTTLGVEGERSPGWAFVGGLLVGLALGNHVLTALLLPGVAWTLRRPRGRGNAGLWALGLGLGLTSYLTLPLRARAAMPPNWGGADSWAGFWWLVSGRLYRGYLTHPTPAALALRGRQLAALTLDQFGWWGFIPAVMALFARRQGRLAAYRRFTLWTVAVSLGWALVYGVDDWPVYTLPAWVTLSGWAALGITEVTAWAGEQGRARGVMNARPNPTPAAGWRAPTLLLACGLFLLNGFLHGPRVSLRHDHEATFTVAAVWAHIPPAALVLMDGDRATFGLGYAHFVLGQRPDLRLVNRTLWGFAWYRRSLEHYYGDLLPPRGPTHLQALIDAHPNRAVFLVGDRVPGGVRFAPAGPYYHVRRLPDAGALAVGEIRRR